MSLGAVEKRFENLPLHRGVERQPFRTAPQAYTLHAPARGSGWAAGVNARDIRLSPAAETPRAHRTVAMCRKSQIASLPGSSLLLSIDCRMHARH